MYYILNGCDVAVRPVLHCQYCRYSWHQALDICRKSGTLFLWCDCYISLITVGTNPYAGLSCRSFRGICCFPLLLVTILKDFFFTPADDKMYGCCSWTFCNLQNGKIFSVGFLLHSYFCIYPYTGFTTILILFSHVLSALRWPLMLEIGIATHFLIHLCFNIPSQNITIKLKTHLLPAGDSGSNFGPETYYPDWSFSWFALISPDKFMDITWN
jgi:hypothetical protein